LTDAKLSSDAWLKYLTALVLLGEKDKVQSTLDEIEEGVRLPKAVLQEVFLLTFIKERDTANVEALWKILGRNPSSLQPGTLAFLASMYAHLPSEASDTNEHTFNLKAKAYFDTELEWSKRTNLEKALSIWSILTTKIQGVQRDILGKCAGPIIVGCIRAQRRDIAKLVYFDVYEKRAANPFIISELLSYLLSIDALDDIQEIIDMGIAVRPKPKMVELLLRYYSNLPGDLSVHRADIDELKSSVESFGKCSGAYRQSIQNAYDSLLHLYERLNSWKSILDCWTGAAAQRATDDKLLLTYVRLCGKFKQGIQLNRCLKLVLFRARTSNIDRETLEAFRVAYLNCDTPEGFQVFQRRVSRQLAEEEAIKE
jgi:hypothetical protein